MCVISVILFSFRFFFIFFISVPKVLLDGPSAGRRTPFRRTPAPDPPALDPCQGPASQGPSCRHPCPDPLPWTPAPRTPLRRTSTISLFFFLLPTLFFFQFPKSFVELRWSLRDFIINHVFTTQIWRTQMCVVNNDEIAQRPPQFHERKKKKVRERKIKSAKIWPTRTTPHPGPSLHLHPPHPERPKPGRAPTGRVFIYLFIFLQRFVVCFFSFFCEVFVFVIFLVFLRF